MAKRTRGETLLNAYMNRYVNDQASAVNSGQKNIQNAATVGSSAISAVPTDLPELTDFSSEIYSGLLENEKERQKLYKESVKAAQEAAKKAARSSSSSGTKKTTKTGGSSSSENAELPSYGTGKNEGSTSDKTSTTTETTDDETTKTRSSLDEIRAKKDKVLGVNRSASVKKTLDDKQTKEEEVRKSTKKAEGNASNYAAGRSGAETSTDVGLASTYGAYAQARQSQTAKREQQEYISQKARQKERQKKKQEQKKAEEKTAYENLTSDFSYAQELSNPGVRLTDSQIKAVNQYLKEQPSRFELAKQYRNGELSYDEYSEKQLTIDRLKQKVQFGGIGQDIQAFASGLYQGLAPAYDVLENVIDDATGGKYREIIGGQTVSDVLDSTAEQNKIASVGGNIAGTMLGYGAANAALEGTKVASAAGRAGEKIASGLSKIPGVGNLVTEGTGQAIGNILIGQGTDVALDTIPSLAGDVYDYATDNPNNLTPMDIAGRTAANFGVNAAMNVGSEAIPAIFMAGKNAISSKLNPSELNSPSVKSSVASPESLPVEQMIKNWDSEDELAGISLGPDLAEVQDPLGGSRKNIDQLVDSWNRQDAASGIRLNEDLTETIDPLYSSRGRIQQMVNSWDAEDAVPVNGRIDTLTPLSYNQGKMEVIPDENMGRSVSTSVQNVSDGGARNELQPGRTGAGIYANPGIQRTGTTQASNAGNASANGTGSNASLRAQEITGKSRKSVYTRDIESVFEQLRNGASPDSLREEAARIAQGIVKESDFSQDIDEATSAIKNYLKNTQIRIDENAAADILYKSGLKNIQQYNIQNGTKLSLSSGVPYNAAMQELAEMNVGVTGDTVDDLMDAVQKSKTQALVDTDLASSYSDYVQERILSGADSVSESFDDWLERQGFDYDSVPQYTRNVYDRWVSGDSLPELSAAQYQDSAVPSLDGNLPATAVGAKKSELDRSIVPNRAYGSQRMAVAGLDEDHASQVQKFYHQKWTDAEAHAQAVNDVNTAIQLAGGDIDAGLQSIMDDLKKSSTYDNGQMATANEVRKRLKDLFAKAEAGTPEYYRRAAEYNKWIEETEIKRGEAARVLRQGSESKMTAETGQQKMRQVSNEIAKKWASGNKGQDERIRKMADELEALKKELRERDIADMEREAMQGMTGAQSAAGPQGAEFDAFLKEQGVKTDPTAEFEELVQRVKDIAAKNKVTVSDEGAKSIAGKIQAGESAESYYNKLANEAAGITDLSLDEMEIIDDLYTKAAELPDSKERYELEQQALQIMASHLPAKSWFERFDNIRYLAMLGNTRTHARNILGNVAMSAVTKAKDEVAAAMQLALPKDKRTKSLWTPTEMKNAARQYLNNQAYSTLRSGSKYNLAQGLEAARKTYGDSFGGKILQKLSDLNSGALEKEDEIFLQSAFVRSLASNLSAKGFDTSIFDSTDEVSKAILKNAVDQAVQDAKDATFRSDNLATEILSAIGGIGKDGNVITNAIEAKAAKRGKNVSGFAKKLSYIIANGLLPFTKTPANILKTALEYNPIGGVFEAVSRGVKGQGAAAVTDALAKGTVGTGIIGLGWILADAGLVNGSSDEETGKYKEMLGNQDYSIKIPGFGTYTIDWASPSAVPFLIGVNLSQEGVDLEGILENPVQFAGEVTDILSKALDPVQSMSLLQSLNDFLEDIRYSQDKQPFLSLFGNLATSYAQQFVPTSLGQVARTVDPLRRNTYGGGDSQSERDNSYLLRSTINKIPGLSMTNEPYIDQWGREEASLDGTGNDPLGFGLRLVYNTLSPGYFSAENVTPVDAYIQELFEDTGDSSVIPQTASSKVNVNGENVYMTPEQKTEYAKTSGQLAYNMIDELQDFSAFSGLSSTQQADIVSDVYSLSKKVGAKAAFPEYENDDKLYQAYLSGGEQGAISYLLAKSATDAVKAQGDGASTSAIWDAANSLGLDESSTVQAFLAQTSADSVSHRVYDVAGDSGVSAYMNAYGSADQNGNGDVSQSEMRYALLSSDLDDVMLSDVYQAAFPNDEKTQQAYSAFGDSGVADWLLYYDAYSRQEKSGQAVAESLLDQLGYPNDVKAEFWRMTNKGWKDSSNPYA